MEVAGQWRREWAGTAEYGKVTEGGVTRHVARAMEVLHASAPGARVRVMRAAYHSSAAPGLPAASYLVHSSRRVISSGSNLLESPTTPSKPLEIASMPLESAPETDTEDYKVTEPDDFDISEPSKWKSSSSKRSARMPSEESSSTDNASIIDLDPRSHRKYSYDSESSDIPTSRRNNSRFSPLLDTPVALSTLKYKSLLNGTSDWTNRRKSYSFEDTSPMNESITHGNDTLAMESSTDSGICKSNELINDNEDRKDNKNYDFRDWLSKHRSNNLLYKSGYSTPKREYGVVREDPFESNISLQSKGKVVITVPITIEGEEDDRSAEISRKYSSENENERRTKKVEFCKTELHFAADSGKVNIIATDEKPPPSNDFRRRRSAFVPIKRDFERPITLFGEKTHDFQGFTSELTTRCEVADSDENTAATKGILKNRIPKPKPYLLGENMVFGSTDTTFTGNENSKSGILNAVSEINKQLQNRRYSNDATNVSEKEAFNVFGVTSEDPIKDSPKLRRNISTKTEESKFTNNIDSIRSKFQNLQTSPTHSPKLRQLRDSDLMYFGMDNNKTVETKDTTFENSNIHDILRSVKLIKNVSNNEPVSPEEETPEYQNLPIRTNFVPVPTPRLRSRRGSDFTEKVDLSNSFIKQDIKTSVLSRQSRQKHQDESSSASRSISAPPKVNRNELIERSKIQTTKKDVLKPTPSPRIKDNREDCAHESTKIYRHELLLKDQKESSEPLYANFKSEDKNENSLKADPPRKPVRERHVVERGSNGRSKSHRSKEADTLKSYNEKDIGSIEKKTQSTAQRKVERTQKLSTPEYNGKHSPSPQRRSSSMRKEDSSNVRSSRSEHKNRTTHRRHAHPEKKYVEEKIGEIKTPQQAEPISVQSNTNKHRNNSSKDKGSLRSIQGNIDVGSSNKHQSKKTKEKNGVSNYDTKIDGHKPPRRSEYVINYDDKNGTVSSICKVSNNGTSNKKRIPREKSKERSIDAKKISSSDKIGLLEAPDREWNPHETSYTTYADRKTKTKIQRTCQLL